MIQKYLVRNKTKEAIVRRLLREGPGIYEVQSFNPKHPQLFYKIILKPFDDICKCTCEHYRYNPGLVCKHILAVVEMENGFTRNV